jgi:hypothetical protein
MPCGGGPDRVLWKHGKQSGKIVLPFLPPGFGFGRVLLPLFFILMNRLRAVFFCDFLFYGGEDAQGTVPD